MPTSGGIGLVYTTALGTLGNDALLSPKVLAAKWPGPRMVDHIYSMLAVQTTSGKKPIKVSKLLITIPTLLDNSKPRQSKTMILF